MSTAAAYVLQTRRFLAQQMPPGALADLRTRDVTDAVRTEAAKVSVSSTQFFVVAALVPALLFH